LYAALLTRKPETNHTDILVYTSSDQGRTWGSAVTATPADNKLYFQPQLAVDDAGRVGISAFTLSQNHVDVMLFVSEPGQLRFGAPLRVTSQSFDPTRASPGKGGSWWLGDYQGLASTPKAFHPFWNDTRTGQLEIFTAIIQH
jgi:hypothetical protein